MRSASSLEERIRRELATVSDANVVAHAGWWFAHTAPWIAAQRP